MEPDHSEWWTLNEWVMPRRWPLGEAFEEIKQERTLHTPEEVARARRHVQTRAWAKDHLKRVLAEAEQWAQKSDDFLWDLVLPTTVPRRHYVNQLRGCPVHGVAVKDFDTFHPWRLDVEHHPYKLQCPVGGEWYPSNDFASGDLTSGPYPDDGWGCKIGDEVYYFIAEYAEQVYLRHIRHSVASLPEAYLLTGDPLFAHKAAILLCRQAEEYRRLSECLDHRARCDCGYPRRLPRDPLTRPNGNGWVGMVTDRIWENDYVTLFASAYDAIFDALDTDRELFALLRRQGRDIPDGAGLRRFFETHFLRVAAQALLDQAIYGNDGMHQTAMMHVALVLDAERCRELADWAYSGVGQMRAHLPNYFFKDGAAYESLGGYNRIHGEGFWRVVGLMERLRSLRPSLYPASRYPRVTDDPKGRLLFDFPLRILCIDRYSPQVGDTGGIPSARRAGRRWVSDDASASAYDLAFRLYGEPDFARVLYAGTGETIPPPDPFAGEIDDRVRQAIAAHGAEIERRTDLRDGYGIAFLRRGAGRGRRLLNDSQDRSPLPNPGESSGEGDHARALFLWYGECRGHGHDDLLDIGLFARGLSLMQSLGYPRSWHYCLDWEKNWATHYKVGIGGLEGGVRYRGVARLIADLGPVQVVEACGDPYTETTDPHRRYALFNPKSKIQNPKSASPHVYSRTAFLLDLSDEDCCVVDLFRVRGGTEHVWSFHGPPGHTTTEGLTLTPQPGGTAAGPDVGYGEVEKVQEKAYRALCYMDQVSRARPDGPWAADWALGDDPDTHLRVTVLSPPGIEVIAAKGRSVSGGRPYELDWVLARSSLTPHASRLTPHASQFVSLIEPYCGTRAVRSVRSLGIEGPQDAPFPPVALRIEAEGQTHTVLATAAPHALHRITGGTLFQGEYGVIREQGGRVRSMTLVGATYLLVGDLAVEAERGWIEAEIEAVDRGRNEVTVGLPFDALEAGRFVTILNEVRSVAYRIEEVREENGRTILRLDQAPKIGEGLATGFRDGEIETSTLFPLAGISGLRYYHGARLTDATGRHEYRVADLRRPDREAPGYRVYLDPDLHPGLTAAKLRRAFASKKDALFHLWDFGVGDRLRIPVTAVVTFSEQGHEVRANAPVRVSSQKGV
ncbi:MAG: hypothetical protein A3F84_08165 [Candidatus Handelsmanbacteria bacterium RIFCSPLOWO2_12_FULL_64_10]|uniref:Alginate lyase domain-containing protein n=1 Tax=Handelsmanbacteria sp. (strain RIFCSPLOWO2_12_FULL_64_10) TaxID=1817868 RepID=A0A1F6C461_HANXR|nr:MAG: hypothetical protein A3F84_08165 [Candidatus Handelsmanbacteria bacterium RIFCSPLOWO2_12_FULL_64_10]